MSLRRLSPSANLLRNSRLFALPPPQPKPISEYSETATLPHPVHAAIQTTPQALARGDWGLKRPLPLKSTAHASTRHIYIENIDSIDHIIDFGSATDHTRTLDKWQEMDIALSRGGGTAMDPQKSVFETTYDSTETKAGTQAENRWAFQGPWIAGQTHTEFSDYVRKSIGPRRQAFRKYLHDIIAKSRTATRRRELIEAGETEKLEHLSKHQPLVTENQVDAYIQRLRAEPEILSKHVEEFLDLPREESARRGPNDESIAFRGPPSTHPSAGLSYLRSHSHTVNNAAYGPQEYKPPIEARVLHPQNDPNGNRRISAVLGVNGIVAKDAKYAFVAKDDTDGIKTFNPDLTKGGKVHVQVRKASINSKGRIELTTQRAENNALLALSAARVREGTGFGQGRTLPEMGKRDSSGSTLSDELRNVKKSEPVMPFDSKDDLSAAMLRALQGHKISQ